MTSHRGPGTGPPLRTVGRRLPALLLPLTALLAVSGAADPPAQGPAPPTAPAATPVAVGLGDALHLALEGHPKIAAARASLAAAEDGSRAVETLRVPTLLDRELPTRRRQAALGVTAAAAGLDQTRYDVAYGVTRTYLTVLYAREQDRVAKGVVDKLNAIYGVAKKQLDAGSKDVTSNDVSRTLTYLRLAEARRVQATSGEKRALAALQEAVGRGPDCRIEVRAGRLPRPELVPVREAAVCAALARRGDLTQANVFVEITRLEVEAQGTSHSLKMETFAAGGDIHARQVPQDIRNTEYRPGAIPPEMPTLLAGSKTERMQRAGDFSARAEAVAAEARNLIALEAEDAFLRWEEASGEAAKAREAAETAEQLAEDLRKDFTTGQKVKLDEVLTAQVLAGQARSQYNEYLYRQLLALADLERATAGGFCANLVELLAAPPPPEKKPGEGDKLFP
jgi:outer membrane protein TolC